MDIKYPRFASMIGHDFVGGANLEGRSLRKGASSMKISSFTRNFEVKNFRWQTFMAPGIGFPMKKLTYEGKLSTFAPWDRFQDFKRLDTIGFWELSRQEVTRHNAAAASFLESDIFKEALTIYASEWERIHEVLAKYIEIATGADTSFEHYEYYVKEHASSASPFGVRYSELLDNPKALKLAWDKTNAAIFEYRDWFIGNTLKEGVTNIISAKNCYPGVRARPPDYTIRQIGPHEILFFAEKWRDRKIGGVPILSQLGYPIFNNDKHAQAEAVVLSYVKQLNNTDVLDLGVHGPQVFLDLMEHSPFIYDGVTQEKQTGLMFKDMGLAVDLSEPQFPADFGSEMYSGIWCTKPLNQICLSIITRALQDEYDFTPSKQWTYSDNIAFDKELPPNIHFSIEDTFCGFNPRLQRFGPPSLCTDNPKNRIEFKNNRQKQVQRLQYELRPLLACISNDIGVPGSCKDFLHYVVDRKLYEKRTAQTDEISKDNILTEVWKLPTEQQDEFLDRFTDVRNYVKQWFVVQNRDPDFVTDLRIS